MSRLFKRLQKRSLKQEQIDEKAFKAAYDESCRQWIAEQREHVNDSKESQENVILSQQAELTILLDRYNISVNARDQFMLPRFKGQMKEDENFSVTEKELHNMFRDALKHFIQRFNGNSLAALRRYEAQVKSHLTAIAQSPDRLAILDRIAASYAPTLMNASEIGRQYLSHALTRIEHPATLTGIFQQMIQQMIDDGLLQAERRTAVKPFQGKRSILEYKTAFDKYIEKIDGYSAITRDITTNAQLKTRIFNDFVSGLRYNLRMLTDINDFDKLSYSELVAKFVATENRIGVRTVSHMDSSKPTQKPRFINNNAVSGRREFRRPMPNGFTSKGDINTPARSTQPRHNPNEFHKPANNFARNGHHQQNHKYPQGNSSNNNIKNSSHFSANRPPFQKRPQVNAVSTAQNSTAKQLRQITTMLRKIGLPSKIPLMLCISLVFCICLNVSAWECQLVPSHYGDIYGQGLYNTSQVSVVQLARLQKPCHKISPWKLKFVVGRAIFHTNANESVTIQQNVDVKSCDGFTTFKSHDGLDYMLQILQSSKSTHPRPELQQGRSLLNDIYKKHKHFNDSCQPEINVEVPYSSPVSSTSSTAATSPAPTLSVLPQSTTLKPTASSVSVIQHPSSEVDHSQTDNTASDQPIVEGTAGTEVRKRKQKYNKNAKVQSAGSSPTNKKVRDEGCEEELMRVKKEYEELQNSIKDLEQRLVSLESLLTQRDVDYTSLKVRHDKVEKEHVEKIRLIKKFHDEQVVKLKKEYEEKMEKLESQHAVAIDAATSKLSVQHSASQLQLERTYKDGVARIQKDRDNDKAQLQKEHQVVIDKLNREHQKKVAKLHEDNQNEIKRIHDEHRNDLHTFTNEWSERLQNAIEKKDSEIKTDLMEISDDKDTTIQNLNKQLLQSELSKSATLNELKMLNQRVSEMTNPRDPLKSEEQCKQYNRFVEWTKALSKLDIISSLSDMPPGIAAAIGAVISLLTRKFLTKSVNSQNTATTSTTAVTKPLFYSRPDSTYVFGSGPPKRLIIQDDLLDTLSSIL